MEYGTVVVLFVVAYMIGRRIEKLEERVYDLEYEKTKQEDHEDLESA
jgi:hypothetical protein